MIDSVGTFFCSRSCWSSLWLRIFILFLIVCSCLHICSWSYVPAIFHFDYAPASLFHLNCVPTLPYFLLKDIPAYIWSWSFLFCVPDLCFHMSSYKFLFICSCIFHFDFVPVLPFHLNCIPALHYFLLLDILNLCSCLYLIQLVFFPALLTLFSHIFLLCSWSSCFSWQTSLQLSECLFLLYTCSWSLFSSLLLLNLISGFYIFVHFYVSLTFPSHDPRVSPIYIFVFLSSPKLSPCCHPSHIAIPVLIKFFTLYML